MTEAFEKAWREYRPGFPDIDAYRVPDGVVDFMDDFTMEFIAKCNRGGYRWCSLQKSHAVEMVDAGRTLEACIEELLRHSEDKAGEPLKQIYAGMMKWWRQLGAKP